MKWEEFKARYPKDLYSRTRQLCEEIHDEQRGLAGFFCDYCYPREGWYCFPCTGIKGRHEERWAEPLDNIMSKQR